ncbi:MAG: hypothetical protein Q9182_004905 [Xanthomendoza sp. 2 TL-2023]
MRLALQRLLADSDALCYWRNLLRASKDQVNWSAAGVCQDCRRPLRLNKATYRPTLPYSLSLGSKDHPTVYFTGRLIPRLFRSGFHHEPDGTANKVRKDLQRQTSSKRALEISSESLDGCAPGQREEIFWRLLDEHGTRNIFPVWLELAHTRRRLHGVEGIRLVWRAVVEKGVNLPTIGDTADRLWNSLLELGFHDPDTLKEIFIYARHQEEASGRAWVKIYATVMAHYLLEKPDKAWLCHMRLYKHFPPSNQQLRELFMLVSSNDRLRQLYLSMHKYFPWARIYDIAIPELCRQGLYATAVIWHKKFIERRDLPSSARWTEPVMQYLAATGAKTQLMEYTRLMVAAGVSFTPYRAQNILIPPEVSRELMNVGADKNDDLREDGYSDKFCARLIATRFFSVENIIYTLGFLGVREIGPLALRELAARELSHTPYCRAVQDRLAQLDKASVAIGDSTFSVLVRQLAIGGQSHLLTNLVSCDLHTDTFEDYNLQESLLTYYQENRDTVAFNRTMAILTAKVLERSIPGRRLNLILRSHLTRRDLQAVKNTIERMQDLQISIEPKSNVHMKQTLLSRRQVGRRPADTKELTLLIHIWQDALRLGSPVPPYVWTEILRRLGMSGRLIQFERLALWLAEWYSSPGYRTSLSCILSRREGDTELLNPTMEIDLKPSNPLHPLHVIFAPGLQQGIVAWGFQYSHSIPHGRKRHGFKLDWTWGLSLLRRLRNWKVHVKQPDVSKAFRLRLIALFGSKTSKRKINQSMRDKNRGTLRLYIRKAKEIWGLDLLRLRRPSLGGKEKNSIFLIKECK